MSADGKNAVVHDADSHLISKPSAWVTRFTHLIPSGEVLDLASGAGRHSRWLAGQGHPVLAVDRNADALALAAGEGIQTQQVDLENGNPWPFAAERFAGVVVVNYLHRPLWTKMIASLAIDGILIYETFALGNEQFGKPSNPDFLLRHGELLEITHSHGLQVIAYEDGYIDTPKPAMVQRICAIKSRHRLPPENLRLI
ncbi:class I SAM-dependent methyltransferase [Herminiimonas fonticola]|uniref:Methyltransferase family protein n=1 Tax=Herminiimonas fonticola TaxID=303380 RepID=A0A4R6GKI5_9BURK|nr:class I SAM-dependent methyltransferase [Herminiimonas fonticola]RBA25604.1 Tellurite resistance protein TehB [Herminiimonas fonticola]TDN94715.1 methyltransferase family protein [Herminiimonas fonticola]